MARPDDNKLVELAKLIIECQAQAGSDFCGEQREWYVPRLNNAFLLFGQLFPLQMVDAISKAKHPDGTLLVDDE